MTGTHTKTAALSVTDSSGQPVELTSDNTTIEVETRAGNSAWATVTDVDVRFGGPSRIDTILVVDNSGSQEDDIDTLRDAVKSFAHLMLAGSQNDRVGIVRVSTEATLHHELTTDYGSLETAVDEMWVNRGWTALYDGLRLANETLEAGSVVTTQRGGSGHCVDGSYLATVAFTDGEENNSSDQNPTSYAGDGIDTTLPDLLSMTVRGVQTPIHTVGIGSQTDPVALQQIAHGTGGEYRHISKYRQLKGALESAGAGIQRSIPVCFDPPSCDHDQARIFVSVDTPDGLVEQTFDVELPGDCSP